MKKKSIILQKICATLTALSFIFTIITNNLYAYVNVETMQSQKQYFDSKADSDLDTLFSSKYGKIVSYNNNLSDIVLINIQDLHCDYYVQKNISSLIEDISKKYNISDIYVEGGIGNIDTSFLSTINSQYKKDILEKLLKDGKLTGTEYYSAITGKTNLLKGVENKDIYLNNIVRLNTIITSKDEILVYLSKINKEIDFLKSKYLKSKNKQFDNFLKQNENKEITQEQFIIKLFDYAKNNNISLKNYKNLQIYLSLFGYSVNDKKAKKELVKILEQIKKALPYDRYNQFLSQTFNLTDIQKLMLFVEKFCEENKINLSETYPNLNRFFYLQKQSLQCNPIELVKEERNLIDVIRASLSDNKTELEISYLSDFEQFYRGYLTAALTSSQWEYVKLGLNKFKEIYAKYSISNDIAKLEQYSKELTSFYDINTDRNKIFVDNMNLNKKQSKNISKSNSVSEVLSNAKKIIILVAGGYHTDGINEILNKNGITNITITPNITKSTQNSRIQYEYLAQQQSMSIKQMIALGLISNNTPKEQILAIIGCLLSTKSLDGVNINILVDHLNVIFNQDIKVSLINEGTKLKFVFKDGLEQLIDVDEDIANIVKKKEEQNLLSLPSKPLVRVVGEELKTVMSNFNGGVGFVVPPMYKISKDVCLFFVNNKLYLGNGAVWEIANSEYNGQPLDGVDPIIYEYAPDFMQKAMESKQTGNDLLKKTKKSNKILSKIVSLFLVVIMMLNLAGCTNKPREDISSTLEPASVIELAEYTQGSEYVMSLFETEKGYLAYLPSYMTDEELAEWSNRDLYYVDGLINTFDQANAAIVFLKMGKTEEARQALLNVKQYNCKSYELKRASGRRENLYRIYKSNRESGEILGEIVWVGLAAVQYKLATGSDEFDDLIKSVDEYLVSRECVKGVGYYMGSSIMYFTSGGYSSSEHQLDIMAYFTLKSLLPDEAWRGIIPEKVISTVLPNGVNFEDATEEQILQMMNLTKEDNSNILFTACKAFYKNMYRSGGVVRGVNDYFLVLDPNSWGIQVLLMLKEYDPTVKIEENGVMVEKSIYEESELSKIDLSSLLTNIENNFFVTDEELKANLTEEDYHKFKGYHLYTWSREKFVDGKLNWSFEWSMQVATAYYLMGNFEQAILILNDAKKYAREMGLPDGVFPASNVNAVMNYSDYGWKIPKAPSFAATITSVLLEYGLMKADPAYSSPFYPIETDENIAPSSILPSTIRKINELISSGEYSTIKALKVIINNETTKSLFEPVSFIKNHYTDKGAKILIFISAFVFLLAFGMFLYQAFPLILIVTNSLTASVFANVGTHMIIDFRYLKSIGLQEAINLYGKENVSLTSNGIFIDDKNSFKQIYVINDKPKNSKDFKFKSVPVKVKTQSGKFVKCWMGNYDGKTILFADGADYGTIVEEFSKTKQFETVYGKRTALKANVDVIEIDMNNPDSGFRYSDTGNIVVGSNIVKSGEYIDLQKEISLLNNKKIESVTINQNIAIYIDDEIDTISTSKEFLDIIDLYVKNENLGVNAKILFSNNDIDKILDILELEYGSKELAQQKFIEIVKGLKDKNKELVVIFNEFSKNTDFTEYQQYGIFSYVVGNEYVDGITLTKTPTKFVTNLSQISCFDGSISVIKISLFREEIEKSSGIFTLLTSSLNLKEYMKKRSINFIKQVASNFDYNQIPNIDIDIIAEILQSVNKFEELSQYLKETDSIMLYYLGLSDEEERTVFVDAILNRILLVNYLRYFDGNETCFGLKNKKMEEILAAALVAKYNKDGNFDVLSQESLNENLTTAQFELEFEKMIFDKVSKGFKNALSEINDPQSIDDIIKLIPLYAERNVELRTTNVKIMEIQNIKGILSAA